MIPSGSLPPPPVLTCWVAFGINPVEGTVYLLGLSHDKAEAKERGLGRSLPLGVVGADGVGLFGLHQGREAVRGQMKCWLAANDVIGAEADELIRHMLGELTKVLEEIDRKLREA